jgi:hypothetical protein
MAIKPTDIIEKSTKLSQDWLESGLEPLIEGKDENPPEPEV